MLLRLSCSSEACSKAVPWPCVRTESTAGHRQAEVKVCLGKLGQWGERPMPRQPQFLVGFCSGTPGQRSQGHKSQAPAGRPLSLSPFLCSHSK